MRFKSKKTQWDLAGKKSYSTLEGNAIHSTARLMNAGIRSRIPLPFLCLISFVHSPLHRSDAGFETITQYEALLNHKLRNAAPAHLRRVHSFRKSSVPPGETWKSLSVPRGL